MDPQGFAEILFTASNDPVKAENYFRADWPCVLEPHDDPGIVAAQAAVGGLLISARPGRANAGGIHPLAAVSRGRLFLPTPGDYTVIVLRWGQAATGEFRLPFSVQRMNGSPTEVGAWATLPAARQSINRQPTVTTLASTVISLADMLQVVAVAVNPIASNMRFRWGNSPAGTQYDIEVAAGSRYVFAGFELPLAELQAATTVGSNVCRIARYLR